MDNDRDPSKPQFDTPVVESISMITQLISSSQGLYTGEALNKDIEKKARLLMILQFLYADASLSPNNTEGQKGLILYKEVVEVKGKQPKIDFRHRIYNTKILNALDLYDLWYAMVDKQRIAGLTSFVKEPKNDLFAALKEKRRL